MDDYHTNQQVERYLAKNDEFHRFICSWAGNETLLEILEHIWRDIKRLRVNYLITPDGHKKSAHEHERLVDALESRDRKLINQIVQEHSVSTKQGIMETLTLPAEEVSS